MLIFKRTKVESVGIASMNNHGAQKKSLAGGLMTFLLIAFAYHSRT